MADDVTDAGGEKFAVWFRRNYPGPDTIIHDPDWHAPRILRAALAAQPPDPRIVELEAEVAKWQKLAGENFLHAADIEKERFALSVRLTKRDGEVLALRAELERVRPYVKSYCRTQGNSAALQIEFLGPLDRVLTSSTDAIEGGS